MVHATACSEIIRAEVAELLGVRADALHPGANLVGQGLDSIRMMSLVGRWRRKGIAVDFATLAATPTIEAWSQLVSAGTGVAPTAVAAPGDAGLSQEGEPFPLAPMQHAMWVGRHDHQQLGGVAGHLYVEFDGARVDPDRLRAAATRLALRHPMLRVQFLPDGTQRIPPAAGSRDFPISVADLRHVAPDVVDQRLAGIRDAKSHQQLDGAVFELALTLLPGERTRLHVDLDMQAADAMSYRILLADLAALYDGREPPALGYTYQEYRQAIEAEETLPQPVRDADRDWWAQRIPQLPDPPALPTRAGGERDRRRSTRRWHWLDPQTRDALFARARARGITPAMTLAAAFANVLARWSASSRFLLNLPLFSRQALHPDVDLLVGDFTSSLLLDVDLTGARTAAARAQAGEEAAGTGGIHQRAGARRPFLPGRHRAIRHTRMDHFAGAPGAARRPGHRVRRRCAGELGCPRGGLCTRRHRRHVHPPGRRIAPVGRRGRRLGCAEPVRATRRATRGARGAERSHRRPQHRGAARRVFPPGPTAARRAGGVRQFRRLELRPTARPGIGGGRGAACCGPTSRRHRRGAGSENGPSAVAAALRAAGLRVGDTVAVLGPKTGEQVAAVLGILAAGGVYLPIGVDQPRDRAERILATGSVNLALVCGPPCQVRVPVPTLLLADVLAAAPAEFVPGPSDPTALAYVLFTSGSTGEPKGVEVAHDAAMNTVETFIRHFELGAADRWLALATLECDMSVLDIFAALRSGGAIVVVDEAQRRDPDAWARLIDTYEVTALNFMPGWLDMLLEVGGGRLSSLRAVAVGGDWVRPDLARRLQVQAPSARFAGLGGATETAVHATIFEVQDAANLPPDWASVPYGVPFPNNACRVVADSGDDCPDWVAGELWVSGRGIARGYRGRPELTAERFVEHDGRTWYRTGDLARYWHDGTLEFVGRADHRVKISGYRVELGEIEAALQRLPGVHAAAATVLPGGSDVLAAAVCVDDAGVTAESIRQQLADLVPAHMIPRHVTLLDRIPFTDSGKIDRAEVGALLAAEVERSGDRSAPYAAPRTVLQRALRRIVADILGRANDAVGVHDDFFALGGDSVLATQVVAGIRRWLDSPSLMVADMFAARTIAALAQLLTGREANADRLELVAEVYLEIANMTSADVMAALDPIEQPAQPAFKPWVKRFTGTDKPGAVLVFPHAGGAAAAYRWLAKSLVANDVDTFVVQYPQRADRRSHPAADSIEALALELFEAGDWHLPAPLTLFGHCMGAIVAFEFARLAERNGVPVRALWASSGQAPSTVAASGPLPTADRDVLADMVDLGGTDPVLLEDEEFVELLVPAVKADYRALSGYSCPPDVRIRANIHAVGGNRDHRISREMLTSWETHTSGRFTLSHFDGGHFYLNDHLDAVARMVSADVR
ncbi:Phenyloxazoline synthase mbtB [Mycobacterium tuberculosis variant bovis BCG str. ATCC 35743]|nr:Phenyloxazoline synthase mbtB [Mycobacterium tuberculosis variant bovis BCG str. ATCC 35743]